jgi:hypothetical protein
MELVEVVGVVPAEYARLWVSRRPMETTTPLGSTSIVLGIRSLATDPHIESDIKQMVREELHRR